MEVYVSVVMPAYNAEATIVASIESVLAQTYTDWELIVVDDCSSDSTAALVEAFAQNDVRIHLRRNHQNKGVAATRNNGIAKASGQWIAFLDSDDLWMPTKLEKQLCFMQETDAKISFTSTAYIAKDGRMSGYVLRAQAVFTYKDLLRRNIMSCSSVMVHRDYMTMFPNGFMHEDYATWYEIINKAGQAHGYDEPLLIYRIREGSKSAGRVRSAKMLRNAYIYMGYGWVFSLILTVRYMLHSVSKRLFISLGRLRQA